MSKRMMDRERTLNSSNAKIGGASVRGRKKRRLPYRARLLVSYAMLFCFVLVVGLVLSLTVFFKIEGVEVKGNTVYSCNEIIDISSIKKGSNLFLSSISKGKKRILKKLPYIEKINISRKLPNKVIIEVEDSKTYYGVQNDGKYVLINRDGKVIDVCEENKACLIVKGVELEDISTGDYAVFKDKDTEKNFKELFNELKKWNISNIKEIDFSDSANIMIDYKGHVKINLGFYENISYKIRTAQEIINGKLKDGERGTLDLSSVASDNKSYFLPE